MLICVLTNLKIVLKLISAKQNKCKLLFDFYYYFRRNCFLFQNVKALPFALVTQKKNQVLAVLKNYETTKHGSTIFKI